MVWIGVMWINGSVIEISWDIMERTSLNGYRTY